MNRKLALPPIPALLAILVAACSDAPPTAPPAEASAADVLFDVQLATVSDTVSVTGTVGEIIDEEAASGGFFLRHVHNPAPPGHSHAYQWARPRIEAFPNQVPIVFEGTLDLSGRNPGAVAMIGLLDLAALESGRGGYQTGSYIYVLARPDGGVRIGLSDGNAGNVDGPAGELVRRFHTLSADALAGMGNELSVTFTVDGDADPQECGPPPAYGADAEGCMILEIDGLSPLQDSYGSVRDGVDAAGFADGAVPGWDAFPAASTGISYDLAISPVDVFPAAKEECMDGGWADFGFRNQGQCIRFVNEGEDSR